MATQSKKKKLKNQTAEARFNYDLNSCSKSKDLSSAIALYNSAVSENIHINHHHFNTLLYLCSTSLSDPSAKELALQHGFLIYDHMLSSGIKPNEASITAVTRLAVTKSDGDYAFGLVKSMNMYNLLPRLRTYDPALFCFCEKLEADKAYEVEKHMEANGVALEEAEVVALLKVSMETGKEEKVYKYLHKLRKTVRCVREETGKIIEDWFKGFEGNVVELDVDLVKEAVERNGGGWHGLGWIGKGKYVVQRGSVNLCGKCCCCWEQLGCVDISDVETERFLNSVASLALEREAEANFIEFQDWLEKHADYEAIVDGANVGLYQQNFAEGGFSIPQLQSVVEQLYNRNEGKYPLVILHNKRLRALLENPSHRKLVNEWLEKNALYTTPHGSNDDWYWLYAAMKLRCLIVTNDEMRDHIFELLGSSFFLKWKERHQVRYTFLKGNLEPRMPPPFSVAIQESENGSWHVPLTGDSAQSWICISRQSSGALILEKKRADVNIARNGHNANGGSSKELLHLEHNKASTASPPASVLLLCKNDLQSEAKKLPLVGNPVTASVAQSHVLGKVKDFLGVISEANKRLQQDAKVNSENHDIEVLTGNESQVIEMDLMLGIADLHTPDAIAAAESAIAGSLPSIPADASSSDAESEDSSDDEKSEDEESDNVKNTDAVANDNHASSSAQCGTSRPKIVELS